ncbi:MAG: cupin domain-containing protein [Acetobacteraceae bacterium]|nr:cupin domain-containing protein [Acetobacteraceae bacterium]
MADAAEVATSTLINPDTKLAHATATSAPFVPGRRDFLKYRDLGVTAASGGRMRAQITVATGKMQDTGWHYHVCDSQLVYCLKGWVDLVFEDGRTIRVQAGESLFIPGGLKHNEIGMSEDFEILEVSVPADMGTKPCDPPPGMTA